MTRLRIIADSDEDDNDVSTPERSPLKPLSPEPSLTKFGTSAVSTDGGGVVQSILNGQENALQDATSRNFPPEPHPVASSSSVSVEANRRKKSDPGNTSSLTSITEPVEDTRHTKNDKSKWASEDLTRRTSPEKKTQTGMRDIWDIPSSPDLEAPKMRLSKRRRLSAESSQGGIDSAKKRHRKDGNSSTTGINSPEQAEGDGFTVTAAGARAALTGSDRGGEAEREDATSQPWHGLPSIESGGLDNGAIEPWDPAFHNMDQEATQPNIDRSYTEPQPFTTSQRMLYESLHPSPGEQDPSHPRGTPNWPLGTRSSGMTTVAYPTPSQFKSPTFAKSPGPRELSTSAQSPIRQRRQSPQDQSSPDAITLTDNSLTKSGISPGAINTKHRGAEDTGSPPENHSPRLTRRLRHRQPHHEVDENRAELECDSTAAEAKEVTRALFDPGPDSIPPTKRRSRSRKAETHKNPTDLNGGDQDLEKLHSAGGGDAVEKGGRPFTEEGGKKSRKQRGRPRKADKASTETIVQAQTGVASVGVLADDVTQDAVGLQKEVQQESASPPRNRGDEKLGDEGTVTNEKRTDALPTHAIKDCQETTNNQPATDVTPCDIDKSDGAGSRRSEPKTEGRSSTDLPRGVERAEIGEVTPAKADDTSRNVARTSSPVWQTGKPLYRVGLSKRTRIAPLLKSLRKP